ASGRSLCDDGNPPRACTRSTLERTPSRRGLGARKCGHACGRDGRRRGRVPAEIETARTGRERRGRSDRVLLQQSGEKECLRNVPMTRTLRTVVPPRDPKGRREGFTTGACAAAAAKAATRALIRRATMDSIETTLPNGTRHTFVLEQCEVAGDRAVSSVVK